MSADVVIANFLRLAKEDLQAARVLTADGNRYAVYHLEQAAEKIIRAVMTSEGVHAGIRHELDEMVRQIPDENPLKKHLKTMEHLGAYATTFRYPSPAGKIKAPPDGALLTGWTSDVDVALAEAVRGFDVDLAAANAPAKKRGPLR